jgi:hypothetical protein
LSGLLGLELKDRFARPCEIPVADRFRYRNIRIPTRVRCGFDGS